MKKNLTNKIKQLQTERESGINKIIFLSENSAVVWKLMIMQPYPRTLGLSDSYWVMLNKESLSFTMSILDYKTTATSLCECFRE